MGKKKATPLKTELHEQMKEDRLELVERLNLATHAAQMGIWDWDIQKNELIWDDQMYKLYGLKPGDFGGAYEAWLNGVHPDDRAQSDEASQMAVRGEKQYDTEFRVLWPDGSVHWLKANGQVFRDENGTPLRMVGVNYEITERKLAEERLRESEEFLRLAYEAANLGVWKNDLVTGAVYLDDRARMHYGFSQNETTLAEVTNRVHPEDLPRLGAEIAAATAPTGSGQFATEYRVIHPDGSIHWLDIRVRVKFAGIGEQRQSVMGYGTSLDITDRKQAEYALWQSEQRFRVAIRPTFMILAQTDLNARYIWIHNPHPDFDPGKILGKTDIELADNDGAQALYQSKLNVISTGKGLQTEISFPLSEGSRVYDVVIEPLYNIDGKILGVTTSSYDITERKLAEDALRESEASLKQSQAISHVGHWSWDTQSNLVKWSDEMHRIFGIDPQTFSGDLNAIIAQAIHPDDREKVTHANEAVVGNQAPAPLEYRVIWPDGSVHVVLAIPGERITDEAGNITRLSGIVQDITERKRAEEELHASQKLLQDVVDNTAALVYILDLEGRFLLVNHKIEALFGLSNAQMVGQTRNAFMPAEFAAQHRNNDLEIIQTGQGKLFEEENSEPDGRHVYLTNKFPLFDSHNQVYAVCGISTDMTERKQMEEELRHSNAELEQFAYIASHDLQEPLRTIAGMVQLLQKRYQGQLDERADEYIGHAVESAARMQALIRDLLAYSRVDRKNQPIIEVSAQDCLQTALKNLRIAIEESHAVITADNLPTVHADPTQLTQLFQNLIGNSLKFRAAEPPQVHITATQLHDAWQFAVRDNGIGVEPQYFERIFLVFQRLHTRREYAGTGIGLALCKKIIERHGGSIWLESKPGQGSTFYFTLPLRSNP